jgi:uncharacterized protein YoxC
LAQKKSLDEAFKEKMAAIKTKHHQEWTAAFKQFAEDEKKIQKLDCVFKEVDFNAVCKEIESSLDRVFAEGNKLSNRITEQSISEQKKLSDSN